MKPKIHKKKCFPIFELLYLHFQKIRLALTVVYLLFSWYCWQSTIYGQVCFVHRSIECSKRILINVQTSPIKNQFAKLFHTHVISKLILVFLQKCVFSHEFGVVFSQIWSTVVGEGDFYSLILISYINSVPLPQIDLDCG